MRNKRGFTLIELFVVIFIIGIAVGIGGPAIKGYLEVRGLRVAADRLQGDLQLAKLEAIKRNANCTLTFTATTYTNSLTSKVVDVTQYRGDVRFDDDPGTGTAGATTITFTNDAWASGGSVYLSSDMDNRIRPRRLRVAIAGGISQHIWVPTTTSWVRP